MSRRTAALLLLAIAAGCGPKPSAEPARSEAPMAGGGKPVLVDEMVASVQGRPITLSELEIEVRLKRALKGDLTGAMGAVTPADEAAVLQTLIDRAALIAALRGRYSAALDPRAEEAARSRLRGRFPTPGAWAAFLARLDLSEEEVGQRLRRMDEAQAILDNRVSEVVRVDKQAVDEWLAANRGVKDRSIAQENVFREKRTQKTLEVLAEARRKAAVRVIDPAFAPPTEGMASSPERTAH